MHLYPRSALGRTATRDHVPTQFATLLQTVKGGRHG